MKIKTIDDIKVVVGEMHDSEFGEEDFGFDAAMRKFFLCSTSPRDRSRKFYLEFFHVEMFEAQNLQKVKKGKATAGVFDNIIVRDNGRKLEIRSQDLRIVLKLQKLEGEFKIGNLNVS